MNDYLNNPPAPGSNNSRGGSGGSAGGIPGLDLSNLGDSELQSLLNNMSQSQLMQLFGGGGGGKYNFFTLIKESYRGYKSETPKTTYKICIIFPLIKESNRWYK